MPALSVASLFDPGCAPLLVLKVGSALLVGADGRPRADWLASLAEEIAAARTAGQRVIVVSSGAIALGAHRLALPKGGRASLADAQAAAAVGQIALGGLWAQMLGQQNLTAAQLLLTLDDLEDRRRYLNAAATLARLLEAGAVPVVNENDSVATEEIRFGDNDRLAARVAQAAHADAVVLLSDVDGLYDRDPADPAAQLLGEVEGVSDEIRAMAGASSASGLGSGGMAAKLKAAEIATRAGIALAIINGIHQRPIARARTTGRGTVFLPRRRDKGRKAWLGGRQKLAGALAVDEGCLAALEGGGSLLAAGIRQVTGEFQRGAPVAVHAPDGRQVAQGLVEYSAAEITRLMGRRSEEHAELLAYPPRSAVIHRDQLVLL